MGSVGAPQGGRYNVVSGAITQNNPLTVLIDTRGQIRGVSIQNVSAQDFFASTDPTLLQAITPTNLPPVGHHFPPDANPPFVFILPRFRGKIYARAQNAGSVAEAWTYDIGCDVENPDGY